jgi:flavin-dependent dehydrogenase
MNAENALIEAGAAQLQGMIVRSPDGATLRGDFVASHGYRGFRDSGLAIRRTILDNVLLDRAREAGVDIRQGVKASALLRFRQTAMDSRVSGKDGDRFAGVIASDKQGRRMEISAPVVVGADGLNSIVANKAGLNRRGIWPDRIALVAHYVDVADVSDCGEMHVEPGGYLGIARVGQREANVALVVQRRLARNMRGDLKGFLESWIAASPHLATRFKSARAVGEVLATGPFARRARRTWAPGVALAGDAADFFDPFTGEGIYTALRGGELLASHLIRYCSGSLRDEELKRYAQARRVEFGGKLLVERLVGLAVGFPPLINRAAAVLSKRKDMADLLVGVTGDFVPPREVLRPRFLLGFLI